MAYNYTFDERYAGGVLGYSAGFYDAPNILNEVFVLAENSIGYGATIDDYITADIDVYSLGILSPGNYLVDVDDYTWDFSNYDYSNVSNFKVLDSLDISLVVLTVLIVILVFQFYHQKLFMLQLKAQYLGKLNIQSSINQKQLIILQ